MQPGQMAYDTGITVYSPDGRLFQVEYAREAIKRGAMALGLKYKDGVVLIAERKTRNKLVETKAEEKLFKIDESIGCVVSGLIADGRVLVDYARLDAQINKITYNERIPVAALTKKVCEFLRFHTQFAGVRPFGVSLLIAGVDEVGIHLYETDPSGALIGYKAGCIGSGKYSVIELFEDKYVENMSLSQTIMLGLEALKNVEGSTVDLSSIEIGVIERDLAFRRLSTEDIQEYLGELTKKRG
ncbi:MAG: archaeal proteasome endopeptidase complex subunit alpha [Thermoplasmata archaeon]